ncbi:MAG: hypothetical protein OWS03_08080 [Alicyclobacillaceae bacterium]|nr:hypothetical protein [Alicyclobacillaceae bacterium]
MIYMFHKSPQNLDTTVRTLERPHCLPKLAAPSATSAAPLALDCDLFAIVPPNATLSVALRERYDLPKFHLLSADEPVRTIRLPAKAQVSCPEPSPPCRLVRVVDASLLPVQNVVEQAPDSTIRDSKGHIGRPSTVDHVQIVFAF